MSTVFTVVLVISVLALSVCGVSGGRGNLEKQLNKTNAAIAKIVQDVKRLDKKIKEETKQCATKLKVSGGLLDKGNADHKKMVKTIEELHKKLMKSYDAQAALTDTSKNIKKLKLSIAITLENIQKYEKRRKNGMDIECFNLDKMTTKKRVTYSQVIPLRTIDGTIVLENKLRLAKNNLEQEKKHKEKRKLLLKLEMKRCKAQQKHLDDTIKTIIKNKAEATKGVVKLKEELAKQEKIVNHLKSKDAINVKRLKDTKKKAKKVLNKYKKFAFDEECYSKMYKDVVALVFNK